MDRVSFGVLEQRGSIAIVQVDEFVELQANHLAEFRCWATERFNGAPFGILIPYAGGFSLDFDAQTDLGNIPNLRAIAVLSQGRSTEAAYHSVTALPRDYALNLSLFSEEGAALNWLRDELGQAASHSESLIAPDYGSGGAKIAPTA